MNTVLFMFLLFQALQTLHILRNVIAEPRTGGIINYRILPFASFFIFRRISLVKEVTSSNYISMVG